MNKLWLEYFCTIAKYNSIVTGYLDSVDHAIEIELMVPAVCYPVLDRTVTGEVASVGDHRSCNSEKLIFAQSGGTRKAGGIEMCASNLVFVSVEEVTVVVFVFNGNSSVVALIVIRKLCVKCSDACKAYGDVFVRNEFFGDIRILDRLTGGNISCGKANSGEKQDCRKNPNGDQDKHIMFHGFTPFGEVSVL